MTASLALTAIRELAEQYRLGTITVDTFRQRAATTLIDLECDVRIATRESLQELASL